MKRKASPDILEKLARDSDESVRLRVAYNAKTPSDVLAVLTNDPSDRITEVAAARLSGEKLIQEDGDQD